MTSFAAAAVAEHASLENIKWLKANDCPWEYKKLRSGIKKSPKVVTW